MGKRMTVNLVRIALWVGVSWLGLIFLTSLAPGGFGVGLQFTVLLLGGLAFAAFGFLLVVASLFQAISSWPDKRQVVRVGLGVPAIIVTAVLLSVPMLVIGNQTFIWGTVLLGRDWMNSVIAEAQGHPDIDSGGTVIPYSVDRSGPVRVVFVTNPGFLDNWSGIVFDPTRRVELANGWDSSGKFLAPADVTKLFGGDLVSCRRLIDHFYHCGFT